MVLFNMMRTLRATSFFLLVTSTRSWTTITPSRVVVLPQHQTPTSLWMASKGKGFGSVPEPPKKKVESDPQQEAKASSPAAPVIIPDISMNQGQKALENMRRDQAEKRDTELRKVKEVRSVDEFVRDSPDAAAIPEKVARRMGKRMLPFVGIPLFGGMGTFVAFWYFATFKDIEFQPALVATSTIALLVVGLVGITYSVMSSSWDTDREGSAVGIDEFQKNIQSIRDGLGRSRENTLVRERMDGMPEAEIQDAIRDLDRRDEMKMKRMAQSLKSKIDNELK